MFSSRRERKNERVFILTLILQSFDKLESNWLKAAPMVLDTFVAIGRGHNFAVKFASVYIFALHYFTQGLAF